MRARASAEFLRLGDPGDRTGRRRGPCDRYRLRALGHRVQGNKHTAETHTWQRGTPTRHALLACLLAS